METLLQDLRYSLRTLRKHPGFTAAVVLSLALGIGANSAVFSLVDALLLRPLPVEEPDRLVALTSMDHHDGGPHGLSYRDFLDYRDRSEVFSGVTAFKPVALSMTEGTGSDLIWGLLVSGDYFSMLGVDAALGRTFLPEEDRADGAHPVVVVSHNLWQRRFGGDPNAIGKTATFNGHPFTVVGVAPKAFSGLEIIFSPDVYLPTAMHAAALPGSDTLLERRDEHGFRVWARLRPGVSMEQAQAAASLQAGQLAQAYPATNRGVGTRLYPQWEARFEPGTGPLLALASSVLMATVGLVLLVACANVANLLLARMTGRRREIAIRLALGAGRGRLARQLLTEGLVLSLLGAFVASLIALWGADVLSSIRPGGDIPLALDVRLDGRVVLFTLALAVVSALLFGLAPILQALGRDLVPALKGEEIGTGRATRRYRARDLLVVAQVAISLVLLVCAGLFVRSTQRAEAMDLGIRTSGILLASLDPSLQGYDEQRGRALYRQLLERLRATPGIVSAGFATNVPLDFNTSSFDVVVEGRDAPPEQERIGIEGSVVSLGYFESIGTPVVRGRLFTEGDRADSPGAVVINETMAERFWPGEDPLGKRIRLDSRDGRPLEVVGVAKDGKYRNYFESPQPYLYLAETQHYRSDRTLVVRTDADPGGVVAAIRREAAALDPNVPVFGVKTMEAFLASRAYLGTRFLTSLLLVLGLLGMVLAAVGLYGVMSYSVSRRTREMGVRIALGARPGDVVRLVVGQGALLVAVGIGIGLVGAFGLARVLSGLLYGVSPADPIAFTIVPALLVGVALLASYIPARRAARVDPLVALRSE